MSEEQATKNSHQSADGVANNTDQTNWPQRSFMDDPDTKWRLGYPPDYRQVDKVFMAERTKHHKPGSLEETVQNLVKTWEMETTHKLDIKQWKTIDYDNYEIVVNGIHKFSREEAYNRGTYNMLTVDSPFYDANSHTYDSAAQLFKEVFQGCFPWEVVDVLSGPPKVTFTWHHWGRWSGNFNQTPPSNKVIETHGICIAHMSEDLRIGKVEIFFDSNHFLRHFVKHPKGKCPFQHDDTCNII